MGIEENWFEDQTSIMLKVLALFTLFCISAVSSLECGIAVPSSRIINGENSKQGQWPWQIALYVRKDFSCGGTLIHPKWIVTAAHCAFNPAKKSQVVLGDLDRIKENSARIKVQVKRYIRYPSYQLPSRLNNDIALIELKKPVALNKNISIACLPKQGEKVKVGSKCFTSGWGKTRHPGPVASHLQHARLTVISNIKCNKMNQKYNVIEKQMICAANKNKKQSSCHGDSGGPFVCQDVSTGRWTLQGAVSWGSPECNSADANTVFAR